MAGTEVSSCPSACFCLPSHLWEAAARKRLLLPGFGLHSTRALCLLCSVGRRLCAQTSPEVIALVSCRSQNCWLAATIFIHLLSGLDVGQEPRSVPGSEGKAAPHSHWWAELAWLCPVWASPSKGLVFFSEATSNKDLAKGRPGSDGTYSIKAAPAVITS